MNTHAMKGSQIGTPIVSAFDDRHYKAIRLENGLKAVAISDPTTDKSSASLSVGCGSFNDPKDAQGLAHFLEHLLFMGTRKYPRENDYSEFLSQHGGDYNAYTERESTTYFFSIVPEFFQQMLDRLAQFFIDPLLLADCVEREVMAVHSEHQKNLLSDAWRTNHVIQSVADPDHPLSQFTTGDKNTLLKENIRDRVIQLYRECYRADRMQLVVYGNESVDIMIGWVEELFSSVPGESLDYPQLGLPFKQHFLPKLMRIQSVKELREIIFTWQLPSLFRCYQKKVDGYLTHLIGHEGPGSPLSTLKALGLATGLSCYCENFHSFSLLVVSVDLTEHGETEFATISQVLFTYITLLQREGARKEVFDECAAIATLEFTYQERSTPANYVQRIAKNLHRYSMADAIYGSYAWSDFDPNVISSFIGQLLPENCLIALVGKNFIRQGCTSLKTEPNYGTVFTLDPIEAYLMDKIFSADFSKFPLLSLPSHNPYIPKDFRVLGSRAADTASYPENILPGFLWYKLDDQFLLPRGNVYFLLEHEFLFRKSAKMAIMADIFVGTFLLQQAECYYDATLAGITFTLQVTPYGLEGKVMGYSDQIQAFAKALISDLVAFQPNSSFFVAYRDQLRRKLAGASFESAYWHSSYWMNQFLRADPFGFSYEKRLLEFNCASEPDLKEFLATFCGGSLQLRMLIHGNISKIDAISLYDLISRDLLKIQTPAPVRVFNSLVVKKIPMGQRAKIFRPLENTNSCVELYFQVEPFASERGRALCQVIVQRFTDDFFSKLRTQEQLGYVCQLQTKFLRDSIGLRFVVQSNVRNCEYLEERITRFIEESLATLRQKLSSGEPDECLTECCKSVISNLLEKKKFLRSESDCYWSQITSGLLNFAREAEEAASLQSRPVTLQEAVSFYERFLTASKACAVSLWVIGSEKEVHCGPGEHLELS